MAPRRVIADSDDEDSGDEGLPSPSKDGAASEMRAPEPEPLSSQHRPSSPTASSSDKRVSDTTDQSFFAKVFEDQQNKALQQSRLVENIVRQSQRASASSGDVSLPGKGKGRKSDPSSATDVTSPVVLTRPRNQPGLLSDDATEVTTPKKSTEDDEWDVPSSAEAASISAKKKKERTHGKRPRGHSKLASDHTTLSMFGAGAAEMEQIAEEATIQDEPAGNQVTELSPLPAAKKRKISLHNDAATQEANFYIALAPNNLTTMQKLEYQKVQVSNGASEHKSSGATTVAYSTPSRFASSGPPLPWERPSAPAAQSESPGAPGPDVIDISSSPDVITAEDGRAAKMKSVPSPDPDSLQIHKLSGHSKESPARTSPMRRSKKLKSAVKSPDLDELGQDDAWDSDNAGAHRENYKPRPSRRRAKAAEMHEGENSGQNDFATLRKANLDEDLASSNSGRGAPETLALELQLVETQPTVEPKKRGRKKKQDMIEEISHDIDHDEMNAPGQKALPADTGVTSVSEKPKRKRGRPRKSGTARIPESTASETVSTKTTQLPDPENLDTEPQDAFGPEEEDDEPEAATRKKVPKRQRDNEPGAERTSMGTTSPLEEVDANTRSPTKSCALETQSPGPSTKPQKEEPTKPQVKDTAKPNPSQGKAGYRVGLSKRSRIAPLLKIIRK
ncbi:hypothetical protein F5Y15DRAFT_181726 [Xylariaceae sp. FL0016]|nr:hypothetical protein F5Y15DRAFT_181726 [Xylariaceae sp. FL0016]